MVGPDDQNTEVEMPPAVVVEMQRILRRSALKLHSPVFSRQSSGIRTGSVLLLVLAVLATGGCGKDSDKGLPAACPADADQVMAALRQTPGPVRMEGVPLSECLTKRSSPEQVQRVGATYVEAAAALSREARRHPDGPAALRLGYLVGAAHRGASSTEGVHSELIRRLDQELRSVPPSPALRRGERAGRRSG
jgi:hypothetical protein